MSIQSDQMLGFVLPSSYVTEQKKKQLTVTITGK